MKRMIQRLTTTLSANFDSFCNQVENHEAAAVSLLQETRQAYARLTVQQARLQREREELEKRQIAAAEQASQWKARALKLRESDREKAIECLNRSKHQEVLANETREARGKQDALIAEVQAAAEQLKTKIEAIRLKKVALSAREVRANVLSRSAKAEDTISGEFDALFDRWEEKVLVHECDAPLPVASSVDSFAAAFNEEEKHAALDAELDALEADSSETEVR